MHGVYYERHPGDPAALFAVRRFVNGRETAYTLLAPDGTVIVDRAPLFPPRCWSPSMARALALAPRWEDRV